MAKWFEKIKRLARGRKKTSAGRGGIDAGRSAFIRLNDRDTRQKKNLLKKLNLYWTQRKTTSGKRYSEPQTGSGWQRVLFLFFCLALSAGIFVKADGLNNGRMLLQNLDYFRITSIVIEGCVHALPEKVQSASGVSFNSSQFSVDSGAIAKNIEVENNWVKSVSVTRRWPDKLEIRVEEHQPHALITVIRDNEPVLHYIDRSGEPFIRAEAGMDLDYPVITGLEMERDDAVLSAKLKEPLAFLRLVGANNPNLPAQSISEVHIDEMEGLVVYLVEYPFPIFIGRDDIRKKYVRLRRILEVLYKPRRTGMDIDRVAYIRMDYLKDKAIVCYSESG